MIWCEPINGLASVSSEVSVLRSKIGIFAVVQRRGDTSAFKKTRELRTKNSAEETDGAAEAAVARTVLLSGYRELEARGSN